MMFFYNKKWLASVGIFLVSLSTERLHAWAYGYTQMYRASTDTIVDICYDLHKDEIGMTTSELYQATGSLHGVKSRLYPTEARFLTALEKLDMYSAPRSVDLIWETFPGSISLNPTFLGCCDRLVKSSLRNLNFIYGDTCRYNGFSGLFRVIRNGREDKWNDRAGCSLHKPMPLSAERISNIMTNSGNKTWLNFKRYYDDKSKNVTDYFTPHFLMDTILDYNQHFRHNDTYHAIADLEMLSHVLASDKKKIVLYVGGWHSTNIVEFLRNNEFDTRFTHVNDLTNAEISPIFLDRIDKDFVPAPAPRPVVQPVNPVIKPVAPAPRTRMVPEVRPIPHVPVIPVAPVAPWAPAPTPVIPMVPFVPAAPARPVAPASRPHAPVAPRVPARPRAPFIPAARPVTNPQPMRPGVARPGVRPAAPRLAAPRRAAPAPARRAARPVAGRPVAGRRPALQRGALAAAIALKKQRALGAKKVVIIAKKVIKRALGRQPQTPQARPRQNRPVGRNAIRNR